MYRSFGKSKHSMFNKPEVDVNIHLRKTELCGENGIHLFQIFENEWINSIKQDIWKIRF